MNYPPLGTCSYRHFEECICYRLLHYYNAVYGQNCSLQIWYISCGACMTCNDRWLAIFHPFQQYCSQYYDDGGVIITICLHLKMYIAVSIKMWKLNTQLVAIKYSFPKYWHKHGNIVAVFYRCLQITTQVQFPLLFQFFF